MKGNCFLKIIISFLILPTALLSVSCKSNDKPQPFLDKNQMAELLTEIRISETLLYQNRETQAKNSDSIMRQRAIDTYVPILKKYGITYEQFQKLMYYYMERPEELEMILQNSASMLKEMSEDSRNADTQE